MPFWEHGKQQKQKWPSQPNEFLVFFVFKNRKQFLKTLNKQALKVLPRITTKWVLRVRLIVFLFEVLLMKIFFLEVFFMITSQVFLKKHYKWFLNFKKVFSKFCVTFFYSKVLLMLGVFLKAPSNKLLIFIRKCIQALGSVFSPFQNLFRAVYPSLTLLRVQLLKELYLD